MLIVCLNHITMTRPYKYTIYGIALQYENPVENAMLDRMLEKSRIHITHTQNLIQTKIQCSKIHYINYILSGVCFIQQYIDVFMILLYFLLCVPLISEKPKSLFVRFFFVVLAVTGFFLFDVHLTRKNNNIYWKRTKT